MDRRGFLTSCIALAAAPAIVRADALMRIVPMDAAILSDGGWQLWGPFDHETFSMPVRIWTGQRKPPGIGWKPIEVVSPQPA